MVHRPLRRVCSGSGSLIRRGKIPRLKSTESRGFLFGADLRHAFRTEIREIENRNRPRVNYDGHIRRRSLEGRCIGAFNEELKMTSTVFCSFDIVQVVVTLNATL